MQQKALSPRPCRKMPRILSLRLSMRHLQLRCDISDNAPYDTSGILAKLLAHVARMCGLMAVFAHKIRPAQQPYGGHAVCY